MKKITLAVILFAGFTLATSAQDTKVKTGNMKMKTDNGKMKKKEKTVEVGGAASVQKAG